MVFLIAGMIAASIAFMVNRVIVQSMGPRGIFMFIPVVEEILKTGLAVVLATSLIRTHLVFGIIEGAYDFITASQKKISAALISIISHLIFGVVTYIISRNGNLFLAILVTTIIHSSWNALIVRLAKENQSKKLL